MEFMGKKLEDIIVTLPYEDGTSLECGVYSYFEVNNKAYFALLPLKDKKELDYSKNYQLYEVVMDTEGNPVVMYIEDDLEEEDNYTLNISTHIKDSYVSDEDIKIEIHQLINQIDSEQKLDSIKLEIINRFGKFDEDLEIYMYEELFSYKCKMLNINTINVTDRLAELTLSKEVSNRIKGDKLLIDVLKLSTKFNISYRNEMINFKLYYKQLDKHYIYYLVKLLEIVENNLEETN